MLRSDNISHHKCDWEGQIAQVKLQSAIYVRRKSVVRKCSFSYLSNSGYIFFRIRDQQHRIFFSHFNLHHTLPLFFLLHSSCDIVINWNVGAEVHAGAFSTCAEPGSPSTARHSSVVIEQHQQQDFISSLWLFVTVENYFQKRQAEHTQALSDKMITYKNGSQVEKNSSVTTQWPISTIYIRPSKDFPLSISLNLGSKARIECIYIFQLLNAVRIWR